MRRDVFPLESLIVRVCFVVSVSRYKSLNYDPMFSWYSIQKTNGEVRFKQ